MDVTLPSLPAPTISEVLLRLDAEVQDRTVTPDRITILAASPYDYMVRIYEDAGEEYDGYHLSFHDAG